MKRQGTINLRRLRTTLLGGLRGKPHYLNCPLKAHWVEPGVAEVLDVASGECVRGDGSSLFIRGAILELLGEHLTLDARLRERLRAAAEALRNKPGAPEVCLPFQKQVWEDIGGGVQYNPTLVVKSSDGGPILQVRVGCHSWGNLNINKVLRSNDTDHPRRELAGLYFAGARMLDAYAQDECTWLEACERLGAVWEPR